MNTLIEYSLHWIKQLIPLSQLIIDFGLVILIWMVQLIVYPSFLHFDFKNLVAWHQKYTQRISIIVIPLMLMQLAIAIFKVYFHLNFLTLTTLAVILFLWLFTLLKFAPVHLIISEGKHDEKILRALVIRNWWRTFLWSALFVYNLTLYLLSLYRL